MIGFSAEDYYQHTSRKIQADIADWEAAAFRMNQVCSEPLVFTAEIPV
jgi:hypothetical protein